MLLDHGLTPPPDHGFTVGPTLLAPTSRGEVRLRSNDPADPPLLYANYFASEEDLETMLAGVRLGLEIASEPALARFATRRFLPAAQLDDDALRAHIRASVETMGHPAGTCAMGDGDDSVVDPELRVHGVDGLRVVDASVMPTIPRGNTNAPVIMIAEKASDMIRGRAPLAPVARRAVAGR
jgi:choline dehydrogenase